MKTVVLKLQVKVQGDFTEEELKDFLSLSLGFGSGVSKSNPFIADDSDTEIVDADFI